MAVCGGCGGGKRRKKRKKKKKQQENSERRTAKRRSPLRLSPWRGLSMEEPPEGHGHHRDAAPPGPANGGGGGGGGSDGDSAPVSPSPAPASPAAPCPLPLPRRRPPPPPPPRTTNFFIDNILRPDFGCKKEPPAATGAATGAGGGGGGGGREQRDGAQSAGRENVNPLLARPPHAPSSALLCPDSNCAPDGSAPAGTAAKANPGTAAGAAGAAGAAKAQGDGGETPAAKYGEHGSPAILLMGSNNGGAVLKPDSQQPLVWPAWVYCTRYSDRPSSGKDSADPPALPRAPLPRAPLPWLSARRGEGPGPGPPPRAPFVSARRRSRAESGVPRQCVPLPRAKCRFSGGPPQPRVVGPLGAVLWRGEGRRAANGCRRGRARRVPPGAGPAVLRFATVSRYFKLQIYIYVRICIYMFVYIYF